MAVSDYLALITSEHNQQPDFMAWVLTLCQPSADNQFQLDLLMTSLMDLNLAVGDQLDIWGEYVGASRNLKAPLPPSGITVLADPDYRSLIKAVIAQNHWDGTVPGIYDIWGQVFGNELEVLVGDNQDMSMFIVIIATTLSTVALALLINGYFDLRPAGVYMRGYFTPSVPGQPVFGWGIESATIKGWGEGVWIEPLTV